MCSGLKICCRQHVDEILIFFIKSGDMVTSLNAYLKALMKENKLKGLDEGE